MATTTSNLDTPRWDRWVGAGALLAVLVPVAALAALVRTGGARSAVEGQLVGTTWFLFNDETVRHPVSWFQQPPGAAPFLGLLSWFLAPVAGATDTIVAARTAIVPLTVVGAALVWLVARRLGLPRWAAALAVALHGLAPLAVALHREATPANLAIPWALAGAALVVGPASAPDRWARRPTWTTALGAGCIAIAVAVGLLTHPLVVVVPVAAVALAAGVSWLSRHHRFEAGMAAAAIVVFAVLVPASLSVRAGADDAPHAIAISSERWIDAHLPPGTRLVTDDATAADLARAGRSGSDLVWYAAPAGTDSRRSGYVVSTPSVRSVAETDVGVADLLAATDPIAVFGSGVDRTEVRALSPDGLEARRDRLDRERDESARAGAALATNPAIGVTAPIRQALADGRVDLRLLTILATIAPDRPVSLLSLPIDPAEVAAGVPLRAAVLAMPTGREQPAVDFLHHQEDRFRPASVTVRLAPQPETTWVRVTYPPT